jgi:hypothetical protein
MTKTDVIGFRVNEEERKRLEAEAELAMRPLSHLVKDRALNPEVAGLPKEQAEREWDELHG